MKITLFNLETQQDMEVETTDIKCVGFLNTQIGNPFSGNTLIDIKNTDPTSNVKVLKCYVRESVQEVNNLRGM